MLPRCPLRRAFLRLPTCAQRRTDLYLHPLVWQPTREPLGLPLAQIGYVLEGPATGGGGLTAFLFLSLTLLQESIGLWVARGNRRKSQGWMPRRAM